MPDIVKAWKVGEYGTTVWLHELSCGHIVTARRRSVKQAAPCTICEQMATLPDEVPIPVDEPVFAEPVVVERDAMAERLTQETWLAFEVARRLGVSVDSVRLVEQNGVIGGVVVTLFTPQLVELLSRK